MPHTKLDHADAAELAELLQFLRDWLDTDKDLLGTSLQTFIGNAAYGCTQPRADLDRFVSCSAVTTAKHCSTPSPGNQHPRSGSGAA